MIIDLLLRFKATVAYILLIVLINALYSFTLLFHLWGESFSPADITVGCIYIFRDFSQKEIKAYVLLAMLVGGFFSYLFADSSIALASIGAFFVGELIDWSIFTWTNKPLSQRLLLSSLCSCPADSAVFLLLISRLNWLEFSVMTLFKILGVLWVWCYWKYRDDTYKLVPDSFYLFFRNFFGF